jgi:hypothetical protein
MSLFKIWTPYFPDFGCPVSRSSTVLLEDLFYSAKYFQNEILQEVEKVRPL